MKNILLLLLCLIVIGTTVEAKIVKDSVYQIPKTKVAPVIDGLQDNIWKTLDWNMQRIYNVGDPPTATSAADSGVGLTGMSKAMWDENNLYVLFYSVDDILTPIPANRGAAYNQDAIEIYFDGANDHSTKTSRGATQYQFTIPYLLKDQEVGNLGYVFGTTFDTSGCSFKIKDHDARGNNKSITEEGSGWTCEVKIPLTSLGIDGSSAGAELGFELQLDNSNDAAAGRQGMEKWWNASNNSWANPALWGYAKLTDLRIDTRVGSSKSSPVSFALDQNYPNPFNPSTEISFSLTKSEKVKLAVYNLLGKEVAVLVDGTRSAGHQTVKLDAANLSSGVYFYKLQAGSSVLSKKMMLLK